MRRLVVLVLIGGLLVAADFGLRSFAEARLASAIHDTFSTGAEPDVTLHGFPFVMRIVSSDIPKVEVEADSLTRDGLRLTDVSISLDDVSFSWGRVLAGDIGSIRARRGSGTASIGAGSINELLAEEGAPVTVALRGDRLRLRVPGQPRRVAGTLELDGRDLVLRPSRGLPPYRLALPRIIPGVRYDSIRLEGSRAVVAFSLDEQGFEER